MASKASAALPEAAVIEYLSPNHGFFYATGKRLEQEQTVYQLAELLETPGYGRVLLLDGITQVSERWEYRYHEPMVHPVLLSHPHPRSVLIIGGGDGGILREVLLHRSVEQVDFVELDQAVVHFSQRHLEHIHQGAFDDPRVRCHFTDGRAFVEAGPQAYDAVIMDMTDPFGPSCMLYTQEFFQAVKATMSPEAVFSMHGESPLARPAAYACIHKTLASVFPGLCTASCFVPMYATLWSFKYAGSAALPDRLDPTVLAARLHDGLTRQPLLTTAAMWPALFAPDPVLAEAQEHPDGRVIRDARPDFPDHFDSQGPKPAQT